MERISPLLQRLPETKQLVAAGAAGVARTVENLRPVVERLKDHEHSGIVAVGAAGFALLSLTWRFASVSTRGDSLSRTSIFFLSTPKHLLPKFPSALVNPACLYQESKMRWSKER